MFCSQCGGAVAPGAAVCGKCGARVVPTIIPAGVLKRPGLIAVMAVLVVFAVLGIVAALAIPGLLSARMSGDPGEAIGGLRALVSAETSYAVANRGLYDRPECLVRPSACLPGYSGAAFLPEIPGRSGGYRFTFAPGSPPSTLPPGASRSSITGFVMMAAPVAREKGSWAFCVDHTAQIRRAESAVAELMEVGASCPAGWPPVK